MNFSAVAPSLLAFAFVGQISQAPYQSDERNRLLQQDWKEYSRFVDSIRSQTFAKLTDREAKIVNSIEFKVIGGADQGDQLILPTSNIDSGTKFIVLGQGFIRQLFLFIEAEEYGQMYGKQAEVEQHITATLKAMSTDREREQHGLPPQPVPSARVYFRWDDQTAKAVDGKAEALLRVNLAFIIAHEAAHHVLGHTERAYTSVSTEEKLKQEEAADQWAAKTLVGSGQLPMPASLSLVFFERMYDSGIDPSHPSNGCRTRALVSSSITAVQDLGAALRAQGNNPEDVKQSMLATLRHMDESGACPSASGAADTSADVSINVSGAVTALSTALDGSGEIDSAEGWSCHATASGAFDCKALLAAAVPLESAAEQIRNQIDQEFPTDSRWVNSHEQSHAHGSKRISDSPRRRISYGITNLSSGRSTIEIRISAALE